MKSLTICIKCKFSKVISREIKLAMLIADIVYTCITNAPLY